MSSDNLSHTSDYSSGSDKSCSPTNGRILFNISSYHFSKTKNNERMYDNQPSDAKVINHQNYHRYSSEALNRFKERRPSNPNSKDSNSSQYVKKLIIENKNLKDEVLRLEIKCAKIDDYEKHFLQLQSEYESFVESSIKRQTLESSLRSKLEQEVKLLKSNQVSDENNVEKSSQTNSLPSDNVYQSDLMQLKQEVRELRLMLQEKEETIYSLLQESNASCSAPLVSDSSSIVVSSIASL